MLASSELAPNMFGASSELASVMEFGFNSEVCEISYSTTAENLYTWIEYSKEVTE